jgi:hypothetical protein
MGLKYDTFLIYDDFAGISIQCEIAEQLLDFPM